MKQYTTPEQTAKLIELGFKKPSPSFYQNGVTWIQCEGNYSIGELIEMLPMDINNDGRFENLLIHPNYHRWVVKYSGFFMEPTYQSCMEKLIDALYYMILKLKEEEVI